MMDRMHTLCWDCRKACGGCSWSSYPDYEPVAGWTAIGTKIRMNSNVYAQSYIVIACPEFDRDGYDGGARRVIGKTDAWAAAAARRKDG